MSQQRIKLGGTPMSDFDAAQVTMPFVVIVGPWTGESMMDGSQPTGPVVPSKVLFNAMVNHQKAKRCLEALASNGVPALCLHQNHQGMHGVAPERHFDMAARSFIYKAAAVVALPGWMQSSGAANQVAFAEDARVPVYLWPTLDHEHWAAAAQIAADLDGIRRSHLARAASLESAGQCGYGPGGEPTNTDTPHPGTRRSVPQDAEVGDVFDQRRRDAARSG